MMQESNSYEFDPNFAVVYSFLKTFGRHIGEDYEKITIEELINFLEAKEVDTTNIFVRLHGILLRGIGTSCRNEDWQKAVIKFCKDFTDGDDKLLKEKGYCNVPVEVKLRILKNLCEDQFEFNDRFNRRVNEALTTEDDVQSIRDYPVGRDRLGRSYWFHMDCEGSVRVYRGWLNELTGKEAWSLVCKDCDEIQNLIDTLQDPSGLVQDDPLLCEGKSEGSKALTGQDNLAEMIYQSQSRNHPRFYRIPKHRSLKEIETDEKEHHLKHCSVDLERLAGGTSCFGDEQLISCKEEKTLNESQKSNNNESKKLKLDKNGIVENKSMEGEESLTTPAEISAVKDSENNIILSEKMNVKGIKTEVKYADENDSDENDTSSVTPGDKLLVKNEPDSVYGVVKIEPADVDVNETSGVIPNVKSDSKAEVSHADKEPNDLIQSDRLDITIAQESKAGAVDEKENCDDGKVKIAASTKLKAKDIGRDAKPIVLLEKLKTLSEETKSVNSGSTSDVCLDSRLTDCVVKLESLAQDGMPDTSACKTVTQAISPDKKNLTACFVKLEKLEPDIGVDSGRCECDNVAQDKHRFKNIMNNCIVEVEKLTNVDIVETVNAQHKGQVETAGNKDRLRPCTVSLEKLSPNDFRNSAGLSAKERDIDDPDDCKGVSRRKDCTDNSKETSSVSSVRSSESDEMLVDKLSGLSRTNSEIQSVRGSSSGSSCHSEEGYEEISDNTSDTQKNDNGNNWEISECKSDIKSSNKDKSESGNGSLDGFKEENGMLRSGKTCSVMLEKCTDNSSERPEEHIAKDKSKKGKEASLEKKDCQRTEIAEKMKKPDEKLVYVSEMEDGAESSAGEESATCSVIVSTEAEENLAINTSDQNSADTVSSNNDQISSSRCSEEGFEDFCDSESEKNETRPGHKLDSMEGTSLADSSRNGTEFSPKGQTDINEQTDVATLKGGDKASPNFPEMFHDDNVKNCIREILQDSAVEEKRNFAGVNAKIVTDADTPVEEEMEEDNMVNDNVSINNMEDNSKEANDAFSEESEGEKVSSGNILNDASAKCVNSVEESSTSSNVCNSEDCIEEVSETESQEMECQLNDQIRTNKNESYPSGRNSRGSNYAMNASMDIDKQNIDNALKDLISLEEIIKHGKEVDHTEGQCEGSYDSGSKSCIDCKGDSGLEERKLINLVGPGKPDIQKSRNGMGEASFTDHSIEKLFREETKDHVKEDKSKYLPKAVMLDMKNVVVVDTPTPEQRSIETQTVNRIRKKEKKSIKTQVAKGEKTNVWKHIKNKKLLKEENCNVDTKMKLKMKVQSSLGVKSSEKNTSALEMTAIYTNENDSNTNVLKSCTKITETEKCIVNSIDERNSSKRISEEKDHLKDRTEKNGDNNRTCMVVNDEVIYIEKNQDAKTDSDSDVDVEALDKESDPESINITGSERESCKEMKPEDRIVKVEVNSEKNRTANFPKDGNRIYISEYLSDVKTSPSGKSQREILFPSEAPLSLGNSVLTNARMSHETSSTMSAVSVSSSSAGSNSVNTTATLKTPTVQSNKPKHAKPIILTPKQVKIPTGSAAFVNPVTGADGFQLPGTGISVSKPASAPVIVIPSKTSLSSNGPPSVESSVGQYQKFIVSNSMAGSSLLYKMPVFSQDRTLTSLLSSTSLTKVVPTAMGVPTYSGLPSILTQPVMSTALQKPVMTIVKTETVSSKLTTNHPSSVSAAGPDMTDSNISRLSSASVLTNKTGPNNIQLKHMTIVKRDDNKYYQEGRREPFLFPPGSLAIVLGQDGKYYDKKTGRMYDIEIKGQKKPHIICLKETKKLIHGTKTLKEKDEIKQNDCSQKNNRKIEKSKERKKERILNSLLHKNNSVVMTKLKLERNDRKNKNMTKSQNVEKVKKTTLSKSKLTAKVEEKSRSKLDAKVKKKSDSKLYAKIGKKKRKPGRPKLSDSSDSSESSDPTKEWSDAVDMSEEEATDSDYDYERISHRVRMAKNGELPKLPKQEEDSDESDTDIEENSGPQEFGRNAQLTAKIMGIYPLLESSGDEGDPRSICSVCNKSDGLGSLLICDDCDNCYHMACLSPPLTLVPQTNWLCPECEHNMLIESLRDKRKTAKRRQYRSGKNRPARNDGSNAESITLNMFKITEDNILSKRLGRSHKEINYSYSNYDNLVSQAVKEGQKSSSDSEVETTNKSKTNSKEKSKTKPLMEKSGSKPTRRIKSRKVKRKNKPGTGPTKTKKQKLTSLEMEGLSSDNESDYSCSDAASSEDYVEPAEDRTMEAKADSKGPDDGVYYTVSGRKTNSMSRVSKFL